MTAYVIRHAKAGDRGEWDGDDRLRPLTRSGNRQAEALAKRLKTEPIDTILSSPYVRCMQTVEPLAAALKLSVQASDDLVEGAGGMRILELVKEYRGRYPAICTHGDLTEELLEILIERDVISRARVANEKGGVWVLDETNGEIRGAKYLAAP